MNTPSNSKANHVLYRIFFGYWANVKIKIQKQGDHELSKNIRTQMACYETQLLDNPVMASALYLDARYQRALTEDRKTLAIHFLAGLYDKITRISDNTNTLNNNSNHDSYDELEEYLNSIDTNSSSNQNNSIQTLLQNFDGKRAPMHTKVIEYWNANKTTYPEQYKLSCVIFAVPATQSSVERAFSALLIILTSRRNRLGDKTLQNLLLIRLNNILYKKMFSHKI